MKYREEAAFRRAIDNLRSTINILEDLYMRGKIGYATTEINCDRTETETETETTCTG